MRLILVKVWITQHSLKSLLKYLISSKWCGSKIILHSPKKKLTTPRKLAISSFWALKFQCCKLGQKHITFIWLRPFKSAGWFCLRSFFTKWFYRSPLKLLAILIVTHPQQRHRAFCMELGYICFSSQSKLQMVANQQCKGLIFVQPDPLQKISFCMACIPQFFLFL